MTPPVRLAQEQDLHAFVQRQPLCAIYFSSPDCAVCQALRPKLLELLHRGFPRLALAEVDCRDTPALAAQEGVFSVPTLIVYVEGREGLRKARAFALGELARELRRPYQLLFD